METQGLSGTDVQTSIDAVATMALTEQPDLAPHATPEGTVTIMFSDIEGSTPMNERLGDIRWMELLREHNDIIREQLQAHSGHEVKTEGDGVMVAFQSARAALRCAIAMQRAFAERNQSADEAIRVRIGRPTGEVSPAAGASYGKPVFLAARIANQAKGGEILVSALLRELTESAGDIAFGEERNLTLKGLSGSQGVYSVGWV